MPTIKINEQLAIITPMYGCLWEDKIYLHLSFGRVVALLSQRYRNVVLCIPIKKQMPDMSRDYCLECDNVDVLVQPFYSSSIQAINLLNGIRCAYKKAIKNADVVFVRGMTPYVWLLYYYIWKYKKNICHWIVGNPIALLRSHQRASTIKDFFSLLYAIQDRFFTRLGRRLTNGAFICNGEELGKIYSSPRTIVTVSTTISESEFYKRNDTCCGDKIRILFIGFVRPEKGIEYLIEAVSELKINRPWELILVGPREQFASYVTKLEDMIQQLGIADKIKWTGYISYGPDMFSYLRSADIFVLPTLSEGTPRVLVEARANSVPIIATNVGGIPTSVKNGYDGILVPPKDVTAINDAIMKIIFDEELRKSLIKNGMQTAKELTVNSFANKVVVLLEEESKQ